MPCLIFFLKRFLHFFSLVGLIDMLNARLSCETMTITIAVQSPGVRLNLVDRHRQLFYENLDAYDLFIYSEVRNLLHEFCVHVVHHNLCETYHVLMSHRWLQRCAFP